MTWNENQSCDSYRDEGKENIDNQIHEEINSLVFGCRLVEREIYLMRF